MLGLVFLADGDDAWCRITVSRPLARPQWNMKIQEHPQANNATVFTMVATSFHWFLREQENQGVSGMMKILGPLSCLDLIL